MKKAFTIFAAVSAFLIASATYAKNNDAFKITTFGGPNIEITKTTGLTVSSFYNTNCVAFGYFTFDPATGNILTKETVAVNGMTPTYMGTFEEGTHVGLWLQTKEGADLKTTDPASSNIRSYDRYNGDEVFIFRSGPQYTYANMYAVIGTTEPQTPSGQPLPGVLLSGIIGLGAAGYAKLKKRRKI